MSDDRSATPGSVIAVLGAESTGKTTLARGLHGGLARQGRRVALVEEYLREFCLREGRTPRHAEQAGIAREQSRRIAEAARTHEFVVADTTALMVAIYSQLLFDDDSLLADAVAEQSRYRLTLLTALDLPWAADGFIRDGDHVRAPVDALLRQALRDGQVECAVVSGSGAHRLAHAERALAAALRPAPVTEPRWRHLCAECGEPDCERHLLRRSGLS
ncbi:MAG TPA: ATP-binding protein [Burkholderiaceae bacterium]|nr:ATP-binding protein [Burkholderiaceae bacterium]